MPVTDQTTSNSSTGNGVTTVYPYTYKILDEADILVEVDGVAKTLTTHYTVSGVGVSGGGNVTFVTAPASGAVVVLSRSMAYSRDTDYQESGDLLAATLDEDVDRVTMLVQQVRQLIRRAVKLPSGVTADQVLGTGNTAAERASKLIGFDSDGDPALFTVADLDPSLVTAFIATLFDDADAETARTTLGLPDVSQAEAEAGTGTSVMAWTPERVAQAIAALAPESASQAEMEAGTDAALRSMSPLRVAQAIASLASSMTLKTLTATTSGTSKDFTSIPSTAKRITVMFSGMSTNGTSHPIVQLGVSGTPETSSYVGAVSQAYNASAVVATAFSAGFILNNLGSAPATFSGQIVLTLMDAATNLWACSGVIGQTGGPSTYHIAGHKALAGTLDMVRITTTNGTDAFDAGSVNVAYE